MKHVNIRLNITEELSEKLEALAKAQNRTVAGMARHIVSTAIADHSDGNECPIKAWASECCQCGEGLSQRSAELYKSYCDWAFATKAPRMSAKRWNQEMISAGFQRYKSSVSHFGGISLKAGDQAVV